MDYIASLIDTINLKFNYTFTTNSNIDYNATYYIEAITRVYGKDNKNVLYEKKEILTDEEEINKTNIMASNFFKEVNIDYDHFNSFAKEFKTSYFISYDSDVTIVLHVNTIGKSMTFNKNIESDGIALVVIPLTEQTINVTIDSKNINNTGSIIDDDIWSNINYIYFSCFVIFFLIDLYFVYGLIKVFTKSLRNQSEYDKTLKRILRDYDSIIANSLSPIEDSDYKVLDLSSFDELRDVHDNLGMPIIFNEVIKGEISCFSITYDNLLYRYTLNANDLRKKWRQR